MVTKAIDFKKSVTGTLPEDYQAKIFELKNKKISVTHQQLTDNAVISPRQFYDTPNTIASSYSILPIGKKSKLLAKKLFP